MLCLRTADLEKHSNNLNGRIRLPSIPESQLLSLLLSEWWDKPSTRGKDLGMRSILLKIPKIPNREWVSSLQTMTIWSILIRPISPEWYLMNPLFSKTSKERQSKNLLMITKTLHTSCAAPPPLLQTMLLNCAITQSS